MMIDGVHFAESCCVVALGIDLQGTKHPLALVEGSTENATLTTDLLVGLRDRGLDVTRPILVVLDGSSARERFQPASKESVAHAFDGSRVAASVVWVFCTCCGGGLCTPLVLRAVFVSVGGHASRRPSRRGGLLGAGGRSGLIVPPGALRGHHRVARPVARGSAGPMCSHPRRACSRNRRYRQRFGIFRQAEWNLSIPVEGTTLRAVPERQREALRLVVQQPFHRGASAGRTGSRHPVRATMGFARPESGTEERTMAATDADLAPLAWENQLFGPPSTSRERGMAAYDRWKRATVAVSISRGAVGPARRRGVGSADPARPDRPRRTRARRRRDLPRHLRGRGLPVPGHGSRHRSAGSGGRTQTRHAAQPRQR